MIATRDVAFGPLIMVPLGLTAPHAPAPAIYRVNGLLNLAGFTAVAGLLACGLYRVSELGIVHYPTGWLLWLALAPLTWWLICVVRLGHLGKQDSGLLLIPLPLMLCSAEQWQARYEI